MCKLLPSPHFFFLYHCYNLRIHWKFIHFSLQLQKKIFRSFWQGTQQKNKQYFTTMHSVFFFFFQNIQFLFYTIQASEGIFSHFLLYIFFHTKNGIDTHIWKVQAELKICLVEVLWQTLKRANIFFLLIIISFLKFYIQCTIINFYNKR